MKSQQEQKRIMRNLRAAEKRVIKKIKKRMSEMSKDPQILKEDEEAIKDA